MFDLKGFRKTNKISQVELAEYLGVGQGFISQMEKGDRPIPDHILETIVNNPNWSADKFIEAVTKGDFISDEEDLRNECDALRNKVAQLEQTIISMAQQASSQDFIEQNGGRGNIGKIAGDTGELLALRKEVEIVRRQNEELKAQNEKFWGMIEKLMATK